ncbi:non-specific lipid-transfer protein 3 [Capsella rubella]|nr:non-specific lipid-transfer protein 3 [Capsella rubella]
MALALRFLTCLVLTVCIVASADAAISCGTVATSLAPCANYLSKGGEVPVPCCGGVKSLISMAQTTPDRQQACRCLQSTAKGMSGLDPSLASGLPGKCGVSIPYPISMSTNCDNVK